MVDNFEDELVVKATEKRKRFLEPSEIPKAGYHYFGVSIEKEEGEIVRINIQKEAEKKIGKGSIRMRKFLWIEFGWFYVIAKNKLDAKDKLERLLAQEELKAEQLIQKERDKIANQK